MKELFFRKTVDQSLLKSGLNIPKELQNKLLEAVGVALNKGDKETICLLMCFSHIATKKSTVTIDFMRALTRSTLVACRSCLLQRRWLQTCWIS